MIKKVLVFLIPFIVVSLLSVYIVYALNTWDTGYSLSSTDGFCVKYTSGSSYGGVTAGTLSNNVFIPTNTSAEWISFRDNPPPSVTTFSSCTGTVSISYNGMFFEGSIISGPCPDAVTNPSGHPGCTGSPIGAVEGCLVSQLSACCRSTYGIPSASLSGSGTGTRSWSCS